MAPTYSGAKVALVTGASSGIGKAIARRLSEAGYRVFGASRSGAPIDGLAVEMIAMNVDDDVSVVGAIKRIIESAGRIDALVNNAGWALMGPIEETSIAEARAQMETNFFGVLRLCREVLPIMRGQGGGHIVNISSLSGVFGTPFSGLYSASKFAVEGLSEALRFETQRMGIKVSLIEPGDMDTALPASRRTVAAANAQSPYAATFAKFQANQAKDEKNAMSPEAVATLALRILNAPSPRMRYAVANLGQRIVAPLKRFLPFGWFAAIVGAAMGV